MYSKRESRGDRAWSCHAAAAAAAACSALPDGSLPGTAAVSRAGLPNELLNRCPPRVQRDRQMLASCATSSLPPPAAPVQQLLLLPLPPPPVVLLLLLPLLLPR